MSVKDKGKKNLEDIGHGSLQLASGFEKHLDFFK